ncbi:MAG: hypothetical protein RID53_24035 [Coleofasciculus sp. B1-GNL1-01]|uniref:hypothetical protein n=1 Tax=Coleofasciculus sp. B1-GNL1-01 TaxID=3068484 RepID=UPI0032F74214
MAAMGGNATQLPLEFSTLSPDGGGFQAIALLGSLENFNGQLYFKIQKSFGVFTPDTP